mgnify:CR=1 FL=1
MGKKVGFAFVVFVGMVCGMCVKVCFVLGMGYNVG